MTTDIARTPERISDAITEVKRKDRCEVPTGEATREDLRNAVGLVSSNDNETYLNSLPNDISTLDIRRKGIPHLPDLTRFTNLKTLYCSNNKFFAYFTAKSTKINLL